jgi:hypothetical protein
MLAVVLTRRSYVPEKEWDAQWPAAALPKAWLMILAIIEELR